MFRAFESKIEVDGFQKRERVAPGRVGGGLRTKAIESLGQRSEAFRHRQQSGLIEVRPAHQRDYDRGEALVLAVGENDRGRRQTGRDGIEHASLIGRPQVSAPGKELQQVGRVRRDVHPALSRIPTAQIRLGRQQSQCLVKQRPEFLLREEGVARVDRRDQCEAQRTEGAV